MLSKKKEAHQKAPLLTKNFLSWETFLGRLTSNAQVNTLKDERQVVTFSIAINSTYRAKDNDEPQTTTAYMACAYWLSTKVAEHLTKGSVVEVSGRLFVRAYLSGEEPKASLNCHVAHIKIHHFQKGPNTPAPVAAIAAPAEGDDNLSF